MILVEKYPCNDHLEALQRERYWCELLKVTLNTQIPTRTPKERYETNKEIFLQKCKKRYMEKREVLKEKSLQHYKENKEQIKVQMKQYRLDNKEQLNLQKKQYRLENIDKIKLYQSTVINCQCGCSYTRSHKLRHERSQQHQEYENNILYYKIKHGLEMIKMLDAQFNKKIIYCNNI